MHTRRVSHHVLCTVGLFVLLASPLAAIGQERTAALEPATPVTRNRQDEASAALGATGPIPAHAAEAANEAAPAAAAQWVFEIVDDGANIDNLSNRSLAIDDTGRPHATFAGEHLYYASDDGAGWQSTVVDPDAADCPSLALDSAGRPHIAYTT
jgi:hypothetical protein